MKKISVVTGIWVEYGVLRMVMGGIRQSQLLELQLEFRMGFVEGIFHGGITQFWFFSDLIKYQNNIQQLVLKCSNV